MVYLSISMGYRNCYRRYMALLGYKVTCKPNGAIVVEGEGGKEIDLNEFVSFACYYAKWKKDFPQLKVSRPVEDICQYCYTFANQHRYLSRQSGKEMVDDDSKSEAEDDELMGDISAVLANLNIDGAESAATVAAEAREILLLEFLEHIKMARAQRALYQVKVSAAVDHAKESVDHGLRTYTFVVDYGQNMELPIYNSEQPGCTYYFSPLSVYNLWMVNHAHEYEVGQVSEHMYAHVYHEGVGK